MGRHSPGYGRHDASGKEARVQGIVLILVLRPVLMTNRIEEFQSLIYARFCLDLYGNLGVCIGVSFNVIRRRLGSVLILGSPHSSLSVGLMNGGFGGLFWTWCGTVLCYSTIVASLAELESMSVAFMASNTACSPPSEFPFAPMAAFEQAQVLSCHM